MDWIWIIVVAIETSIESLMLILRYDVTWVWPDRVKIARKWLRRTKQGWRASEGLENDGPRLWLRRKYLHWVEVIIKLWGVILYGGLNHYWIISESNLKTWMKRTCDDMVQVTCSRWFAQMIETKVLATLMNIHWEDMTYEDTKDSSGWNRHILLILSIDMSYYQERWNTNS
jgi:hypothetical protein